MFLIPPRSGSRRKNLTVTDVIARLRLAMDQPGQESSDFDLNPGTVLPAGRKLRSAGVLVAVSVADGVPKVILTKRSSALKHHPGQIAFAGGKQDPGDADVTATALREAYEEIGLPIGLAQVLGVLPCHETVTGFRVTPVVAVLQQNFAIVPEPGEVAEVFTVPLAHLANPDNYLIESRFWRGARRYYYVVPYGPYYVWGATARMLRGLAERMARV
ncbi:MAG: CoA pyrophosphatase [Rhodobacteraceae bacterium]|nr:MAG: CoA pyrophosphatase [Paracoccaceae bacterium]